MPKTAVRISVLYMFFAVLSTIINVSSQMLFIWKYIGLYSFKISILVGAGLSLLYFLEKSCIFAFTSKSFKYDKSLFVFCSATGVTTNQLFWSTEYDFHLIYSMIGF
jgi:hypothetical protein